MGILDRQEKKNTVKETGMSLGVPGTEGQCGWGGERDMRDGSMDMRLPRKVGARSFEMCGPGKEACLPPKNIGK